VIVSIHSSRSANCSGASVALHSVFDLVDFQFSRTTTAIEEPSFQSCDGLAGIVFEGSKLTYVVWNYRCRNWLTLRSINEEELHSAVTKLPTTRKLNSWSP